MRGNRSFCTLNLQPGYWRWLFWSINRIRLIPLNKISGLRPIWRWSSMQNYWKSGYKYTKIRCCQGVCKLKNIWTQIRKWSRDSYDESDVRCMVETQSSVWIGKPFRFKHWYPTTATFFQNCYMFPNVSLWYGDPIRGEKHKKIHCRMTIYANGTTSLLKILANSTDKEEKQKFADDTSQWLDEWMVLANRRTDYYNQFSDEILSKPPKSWLIVKPNQYQDAVIARTF